jgi:prepilin-type N-terminal cleavage/methylation domain-containing protein
MAQKYTILKAITRTSNKGFTLLELLIGMIITLIIGGLAMQAFINASATFSKDKKSIDSTQNLSAVLDIIGNDIKQAGENIGDPKFPAIEFDVDFASTANPKSSKITIRRALSDPLTLCQDLPANPTATTEILVADTTNGNQNCKVTQLIAARTTTALSSVTFILPATATNVLPSPALNLLLPSALRNARDYRCQLPDPNRDYSSATTDFCDSLTGRNLVKVAVSDGLGHIFVFNQTGETKDSGNAQNDINPSTYSANSTITPSIFQKYRITVDTTDTTPDPDSMLANNANNIVDYKVGKPIYLIEERVYTLDNLGNLQVSVDGKPPSTLIKRIGKFTVSARRYTDPVTIDKTPNLSPSNSCDSTTNTQFATNSAYTCKFRAIPIPTAPDTYNWKTLAGVKIEIQAKYDGTGGVSETSTAPADIAAVAAAKVKLTATAEFFPRNVLSK